MESESFIKIIIFIVLLFLSAFFSGSETAFFSLSKMSLNRLKEINSRNARLVVQLLTKPRDLLISIIASNTIVNVAAATTAALLASDMSRQFQFSEGIGIFIEVVVVTFVFLILSEITPKILAIKNAEVFSQRAAIPLKIVFTLLYPLTALLVQIPTLISKMLGVQEKEIFLSEDELKTLIEVGEEKGALEEDEKEMIHSIFEFARTTVREIMVPRIDMVCVEKNTSIKELVDIIKQRGHTRIPLYEDKVDNILGIIHAKDLLPYLKNKADHLNLASLARKAIFVPESKMIDELLKEFKKEKTHMAIVVDEYGGTAGLITLEDVIEEIVGEIQDEYDVEQPLYKRIDNNTLVVQAKIDIDELNEILDIDLPTKEGYESLGGFIFNITGYVPKENEVVRYNGYSFVVEKIDRNRIVQVRIIREQQEISESNGPQPT